MWRSHVVILLVLLAFKDGHSTNSSCDAEWSACTFYDLVISPEKLLTTSSGREIISVCWFDDFFCPLTNVTLNSGRFENDPDKPYYLCGGAFSDNTWVPGQFSPIVHVVNVSMFFSNSQKTQPSSGEKSDSNEADLVNKTDDASEGAKETNYWCMLVNFFAPDCPFSAKLAPSYNALARAFPSLFVAAVDATVSSKLNLIYGVSGTPTLILFQNGRPVIRFDHNRNYDLANLIHFISAQTDLVAEANVSVHEVDFLAPLHSVVEEKVDICLRTAWIFVILCCTYYFFTSALAERIFDIIRRNWREMNEE